MLEQSKLTDEMVVIDELQQAMVEDEVLVEVVLVGYTYCYIKLYLELERQQQQQVQLEFVVYELVLELMVIMVHLVWLVSS